MVILGIHDSRGIGTLGGNGGKSIHQTPTAFGVQHLDSIHPYVGA